MLPHAPSSVAIARQCLSSELIASGVLPSVIDDVNVIMSELLSNALRHARPLPSGQIKLTWISTGDAIEIAVSDGGAMTEPRRNHPTLSSLGGRGLGIVESLAECWGVRYEDGGTTVWAVLPSTETSNGRAAETPQPVVTAQPGITGIPAVNLLNRTR
ncbi:ATP-binding protein [Actinomadura sp. HBU206391]|nr:ATP-binding protein [Actinomadura sp. HBU206391]